MDELIDFLLTTADEAHRAHLATSSYAEHMALGAFYEGVREDGDALFEALIAIRGKPTKNEASPSAAIKSAYRQLQTMRGICDDDPVLENLFDTVGGHFMTAVYKLDNLS